MFYTAPWSEEQSFSTKMQIEMEENGTSIRTGAESLVIGKETISLKSEVHRHCSTSIILAMRGGGGGGGGAAAGWCRETPYFLALILKNLIYSFLKNPKQDCSKNFQVWYLARWRETTNWCKISNHQVYSKWGLHLLQNLHEPKDKWTLIVNYPCGGWMKSYPRF